MDRDLFKDSVLARIQSGEVKVVDKNITYRSYRITYLDVDGEYKTIDVTVDEYYRIEISDD